MLHDFIEIDTTEENPTALSNIFGSSLNELLSEAKVSFLQGIKIYKNRHLEDSINPKIAIVVDKWTGRFGNNYTQMVNATQLLKAFSFETIFFPPHDYFQVNEKTKSLYSDESAYGKYHFLLASSFFPFPFEGFTKLFGHKFADESHTTIRPLVNLNREHGISQNDLTCFVRSGDIFIDSPNPDYGQPPLSFYKKIVLERAWDHIYVLAEDDRNPVSRALLDICQANNLKATIVRRGMRGDFEFLLGSPNICAGKTSLIPALAAISNDLISYVGFEQRIWKKNIQIRQIDDLDGVYRTTILNQNWCNTPEQRELMLTYDERSLTAFIEHQNQTESNQSLDKNQSNQNRNGVGMKRSELINRLAKANEADSYLEIGVENGITFSEVKVKSKHAVDIAFKCNPSEMGGTFSEMPSNDFFATLEPQSKFDLIFLDGLHTFEQSLLDLLNSTKFLSQKGIMIVDNVFPSDYLASLSSHKLAIDLKNKMNDSNRNWMGDVYKSIAFAEIFLPEFDFATTKISPIQTIFWRNRNARISSFRTGSIEKIARMDFADLIDNSEFLNFMTFEDIELLIEESHKTI